MQDQLASGSNKIPAELFCIVSSSNDFYRTVLVVYEKTEGRMRSLSKIICHCSHFTCFLPTCISSQEHSYSVLLFSTELKMPH